MSDTPRTDAHYENIHSDCGGIDFARNLERELATSAARETDLQRALMFWMPAIAGSGTEAGERAAADSYLLIGYTGPFPFEKSAEDLGWVRASVYARGEGEVIPAGEVIKSRGLPFRLAYDAEVEGANITLAAATMGGA